MESLLSAWYMISPSEQKETVGYQCNYLYVGYARVSFQLRILARGPICCGGLDHACRFPHALGVSSFPQWASIPVIPISCACSPSRLHSVTPLELPWLGLSAPISLQPARSVCSCYLAPFGRPAQTIVLAPALRCFAIFEPPGLPG